MDTLSKISESELVDALRRGEINAFNMIYQLYAKRLLSYIASATNNKEDAEEIVHDIFLNIWKNHKNLSSETDLRTFLFHIAYKRRIDLFRQSLAAPIYEDYMLFQNKFASDENNELEYRDFCDIFNIALKKLPLRLQTYLTLSRIKGLSNAQIANKLKISQKTVRNGISLGLKLLKEQLYVYLETHKV